MTDALRLSYQRPPQMQTGAGVNGRAPVPQPGQRQVANFNDAVRRSVTTVSPELAQKRGGRGG